MTSSVSAESGGTQSFSGELESPMGTRLTGQLLADVESLLIYQEQPWGNIQSRISRNSRPGMRVHCSGT